MHITIEVKRIWRSKVELALTGDTQGMVKLSPGDIVRIDARMVLQSHYQVNPIDEVTERILNEKNDNE